MLNQLLPKSGISARDNLRWLFILRNLMISGQVILILFVAHGLKIPLPHEPLWLVIIAIAAVNLYTWLRLQTDTPVTELEVFSQLSLDVLAIASLLYLTGGATNPVIWIFLLPLIITAVILPQEYTWYMVVLTILMYTILIAYHLPLPAIEPYPMTHAHKQHSIGPEDEHYFNLHIIGMWCGFVLSAGLVAYFVVGLSKTLRERERNLSVARENELRNERVVSLGSLAASAAHDMGTPLGTMAIIIHEIEQTYPEHRFPGMHEKMRIMKNQIVRCKEALSVMSASAGELRAESGKAMEAVDYIDLVLNQWRSQRPDVKLNLFVDPGTHFSARIIAEQTLTLALINILNNAADATPTKRGIDIHVQWSDHSMNLKIRDYGKGINPEIAELIGKLPITDKNEGMGVGLFLTYSTISRIGGKIDIYNMEDGGACTEITLPLLTDENENE